MSAASRISDFVLEKAESEPSKKRAALYRDLAQLSVGGGRAASLLKLAAEIESIDRRCRQLRLDLGDVRNGGQG